ncbi:MAG: hypothetical protein WDN26_20430 [Chitinophagaceae bacterium]
MKLLITLIAAMTLSVHAFSQDELPAISQSNSKDFFIPASVSKKYSLEKGQEDEWMIVYNNMGDDATIQRVNDIRWQGKTKEAAEKWYDESKQLLSEGSDDITSQMTKPAGVGKWNVYGMNKQMKKMMDAMGVKQNQYNFTFTVDKYVAKIFVSTSEKQTVQDAWKYAKEGLRAMLTASGKKSIADSL